MRFRHNLICSWALFLFMATLLSPAVAQDDKRVSGESPASGVQESRAADDVPADSPPESSGQREPQYHIQFLLVRTDWSKGKDAEHTKETLESLLEDIALPEDFRGDLLGSPSRILFPEDFAAGYRPEQLAASLAWMKQRDLVRIELPPESLLPDSSRKNQPETLPRACRLFVGEDVVPVPTARERSEASPFFRRTYGWQWDCMSCLRTEEATREPVFEIGIQRFNARRDDPQVDGQSPHFSATSDGRPIGIELPAKLAGVVRCFGPDDEMYDVIREQGWEPLLVLSPLELENIAIEMPKLAMPTSLIELAEPTILESRKLAEVFRLTNAKATELGPLLQAVISDGRLRVDEGKNSLLAYGTRAELDTLMALLTKLDAVPTGSQDSSSAKNTATSTDQQIKVFHLENAEAAQTAAMLSQLFKEIRVSADKRSNSLIVAGTPDDLDIIEAILLRLDQTPTKPQAPPTTDDSPTADLDSTRNEFSAKEAEVRSLAQGIAEEDDTEAATQLQAKLNRLVTEAFDLRQNLQRAELALLKERIQIVETRLQQRDTLRDEIIRRRVESLLADGPGLQSVNQNRTAPQTAAKTHAETKTDASDVAYQPMRTGSSWVSDDVIRFLRSEDRAAAWEAAYEEQCSRNAWPPPLGPQFHESIKRLGPDASIPSRFCEEYQKFIRVHAPDIDKIIDRRRPRQVEAAPALVDQADPAMEFGGYGASTPKPELEGTVEWDESDYARVQAGFYWVTRPSTIQVRLAQEDLWCYEAVLRAIAKTNKDAGATSFDDAPIKRIETLEIGQPAAAAMMSIRPKLAFQAYFGEAYGPVDWIAREEAAGSADTVASDMLEGPVTDEQVARMLQTGRYVDLSGMPLPADSQPYPEFNLLPVHLVVDIDPARLPDFLAQLAACAMPVEARYVEADATSGEESSDAYGAPIRKKQVRAEIFGLIRIFSPPDEAKLTPSATEADSPEDNLVRMEFRHQPWKDVLEWLAEVNGAGLLHSIMPEGTFNFASSEPVSPTEAWKIVEDALRSDGYTLHTVGGHGTGTHLMVRETLAGQAKRRAIAASKELEKWTKALVEEDRQDDEAYLATVQRRLDAAEKRLANERKQIARMVNESQLWLQESQATLEATRQELETTEKLLGKDYVTQAEFDALQQHYGRTRDQHEASRVDADVYQAAADILGLTPADIEKANAEAERTDDFGMLDLEGYPMGRPGDDPKTGTSVPLSSAPAPTTPPTTTTSTATRIGAWPGFQLRSPEDLVTAARNAKKALLRAQKSLREAESELAKRADDKSLAEYVNVVKEEVASAQRRLELIQAEYTTQLQLRELEVQSAQADAKAAEDASERYEALFKTGALTTTEVQESQRKHEQAKLRLQAAETLLNLYEKVGQSPDLKPLQAGGHDQTDDKADRPATEAESGRDTETVSVPATPTVTP